LNYWVEAKPNEWMLILRKGDLVECAVGLCTWMWPGDQAVRFPSQLNKLYFNAEQVTIEMQGVEVKGMLVWTVHRMEDGPFRCYKAFGDDLKRKDPVEANSQLQNMAVSIIRDRIANLTINDILKNRQKLRNGVKDEMQKILTGWGMWLETCEIQDVKIASRSLFNNLQTEFREKSRQEAEKISAETENTIRQENLVRNNEF
jgi:regulator of protease activity HflC (stomatin/prohibitin superfamily)